MRKSRIQRIVVHAPESTQALSAKINAFYIEVLSRRLNESDLRFEEKAAVIDHIMEAVLSGEDERSVK